MRPKVSIIGTGAVGASLAHQIALKGMADVVLVDIVPGVPQGKALDLEHGTSLWDSPVRITGSNDYRATAGSELIVVTAGIARKPGMSRTDLLITNAKVVSGVVKETAAYSPDAIILLVTNPVDVMTYLALKVSGFSKKRVLGMGGVLDSGRCACFVAREMGISPKGVQALVLGEHGEGMLVLPKYITVEGIPAAEIIPTDRLIKLAERTRGAGAEIVGHLKTGSAYYAPAAAACEMIGAILQDEKRLLPASVYLEGEYSIEGVCLGVPIKLGGKGVEEIISLKLAPREMNLLQAAAENVRKNIACLPG
jgi:malate dehydrogenase